MPIDCCHVQDFDQQIIPDEIIEPGVGLGFLASFFLPEPAGFSPLLGIVVGWGSLHWFFTVFLPAVTVLRMGVAIQAACHAGGFLGLRLSRFISLPHHWWGRGRPPIMVLQRKGRHLAIPFGPYLALGAVLYIFYGPQLINWYLHLGK